MVTETAIRLMVVDDHAMFRQGLAQMLENEPGVRVTGQAGSADEALAILKDAAPTVILLDVDLGGARAIDFVLGARRAHFAGRILVLTAGMSDAEAIQLVQAGVTGIVHKHQPVERLREAIRAVANGEVSMETVYLAPVLRSMDRSRRQDTPRLTPRDRSVVSSVVRGLSNREIADDLAISEGAVKASLRHVCAKLGVRTRSQLVKVALEKYRDQLLSASDRR